MELDRMDKDRALVAEWATATDKPEADKDVDLGVVKDAEWVADADWASV